MKRRGLLWSILLATVTAAMLGAPPPAAAHTEGKMQLAAAQAGPFKITAWTAPDPAAAGEVHVAASIFAADDAAPILDAAVLVSLTPVADPAASVSQTAARETGENNLLYESVFTPVAPGDYTVQIQVTGAGGETGAASFDLEVVPGGGVNWLLVFAISLAAAAAALALLAWRRPRRDG